MLLTVHTTGLNDQNNMQPFFRLIHHSKHKPIFALPTTIANCENLRNSDKSKWEFRFTGHAAMHSQVMMLCKEGRLKEAVRILHDMNQRGFVVDSETYVSLLQACGDAKALEEGKQIYTQMSASGKDGSVFIRTKLVNMYSKCDSLENARQVFDKMHERNLFLWTAMIGGYARQGHYEEALVLYSQMQRTGMQADNFIFPCVLKACSHLLALSQGRKIHGCIIKSRVEIAVCVGNALIDMYGKCGSVEDACLVFDKMSQRDVVSWNTVLAGCVQNGHGYQGLKLFHLMPSLCMKPNSITVAILLQGCLYMESKQQGKEIHNYVIRNGLEIDVYLGNALIEMYSKCGNINYARHVFNKMLERDAVSWNVMITGYSHQGYYNDALQLFRRMKVEGFKPNSSTVVSGLTVCAQSAALEEGKQIHNYAIRSSLESEDFVRNALIDMYAKCRRMDYAHTVFKQIPQRDIVSWNALIAGYVQNKSLDEALKLFDQMPLAGVKQNIITWNTILTGCIQNGQGEKAAKLFKKIHLAGVKPNTISWTVMIAGCAQNGNAEKMFELFRAMQLEGVKSDAVTISIVLRTCGHIRALQLGKGIHGYIIRIGFDSDIFVGNALVDMYAKCEGIEESQSMFDRMPQRDIASWNTIIAGYAQNGFGYEALKLFHEMQLVGLKPSTVTWNAMISGYSQNGFCDEALELFYQMHLAGEKPDLISWSAVIASHSRNKQANEAVKLFRQLQLAGMKPDIVTIMSVLPACVQLASLEQVKEIHDYIFRHGFESYIFVGNALLDLYAKCGSIENAHRVFDKMSQKDVVSWTAIIGGYAMNGQSESALRLFYLMQQAGVRPDHVTFIGVLSACRHAGLVNEGCQYFDCMSRDYGIKPSMEHYASIVDLLGRAGRLEEAHDFTYKMPLEPNASVWGSLLGACKMYGNTELGRLVAERLFELEPKNTGNYVLLSNIYAGAGRWDDVHKVRDMMKENGLIKRPGCSWVEVNKRVQAFVANDK